MKISSKLSLFGVAALTLITALPAQTLAFCGPMLPPNRTFIPENNMQAFVHYDNGVENLVVQPTFRGDMEDFGLVLAVPSRPSIEEAPERIFEMLEHDTNPLRFQDSFAPSISVMEEFSMADSVQIIEEKRVGDYESTLIRANDAQDLRDWLEGNGYETTAYDEANFDYYIDQSGSYYFIALKVDLSDVNFDTMDHWSQLDPLEITFATSMAILPTRILHRNMSNVEITLYTLADKPLYIPDVATLHAKQIPYLTGDEIYTTVCHNDACDDTWNWNAVYDSYGKYLVRQDLNMDPRKIDEDIRFTTWNQARYPEHMVGNGTVRLPGSVDRDYGVKESNATRWSGEPIISPRPDPTGQYRTLLTGTHLLRWGSRGQDVAELQNFINSEVLESWETKLVADGIWGPKTASSVAKFQTRFNIRIDGIVGPQTRTMLNAYLGDTYGPVNTID